MILPVYDPSLVAHLYESIARVRSKYQTRRDGCFIGSSDDTCMVTSTTPYNLHTNHADALHSILLLIRLHHRDLTCLIRSAIRQDVKNLQYCFGAVVFTLKAILESVRLLMTFNVCLTTPIMTDVIRMALVSMLRHAPHQMSHALQ